MFSFSGGIGNDPEGEPVTEVNLAAAGDRDLAVGVELVEDECVERHHDDEPDAADDHRDDSGDGQDAWDGPAALHG